jgi:Cu-Zn family superoxide dismutase
MNRASYRHTTHAHGETRTTEAVLSGGSVVLEREYTNGRLVGESSRPANARDFAEMAPARLVDLRRALNAAGVAVVRRCSDDARIGVVLLKRRRNGMVLDIRVRDEGIRDGPHGFHLHRCGDERNPDKTCGSLCEHYARSKRSVHGGLDSDERHEGDLGNVLAVNGAVNTAIEVRDDQLTVDECYGRAFVLHEGEDDLGRGGDDESGKTGNAGKRYAYAVVGRL